MDKLSVNIRDFFFSPGDDFPQEVGETGSLVSAMISNAIIIAGVILLFLLLFGGFSFIIGAGQGNPQKAAQGKSALTAALIGFIIIFFAYWIIRVVEVITNTNILG
jgi:hypothetical protein